MPVEQRVSSRRATVAVTAAGFSSFALLHAPQPVLPQLAARFDLDAGGASLAMSVATGTLAVAVLPVAVLAEIVGRRRVLVASLATSAVLGLLLPFAPTYPAVLAVRAAQGAAIAGIPGVAAAYLAGRLGTDRVATAVGVMIAGNAAGGMTGRLAAGLGAPVLGYPGALTVVGVLGLLPALVAIRALPAGDVRRAPGRPSRAVAGIGTVLRTPALLAQFAVAFLAMGAFMAMYNGAAFRLTGHPLDVPAALASLVYLTYAAGSVSSAAAGRLSARFSSRRVGSCAALLTAAGVLLTVPDSLPAVALGFGVLTGGFFATHAVATARAAAEAPAAGRGQAAGVYTLAYYLGSSVGGAVGGVVYARAGWPWLAATTVTWLLFAAVTASTRGAAAPETV